MQDLMEEKQVKVFMIIKKNLEVNKMSVKEKLNVFLSKFFNVNEIEETDNIFEKGLVTSLFAMNLVTFIEKEFDISIDNTELDLDNFKDIHSIVTLIERKIA